MNAEMSGGGAIIPILIYGGVIAFGIWTTVQKRAKAKAAGQQGQGKGSGAPRQHLPENFPFPSTSRQKPIFPDNQRPEYEPVESDSLPTEGPIPHPLWPSHKQSRQAPALMPVVDATTDEIVVQDDNTEPSIAFKPEEHFGLDEDQSTHRHPIIGSVNLREMVIYSELLKPKYQEE